MLAKIGSKFACAFTAGLVAVSLAAALGSTDAAAASTSKPTSNKSRRVQHAYAAHHGPEVAHSERLPYGPEYGFLTHIPPNAIRMPGYTFVPGVGILGESCDLPTSACPNEYRDIQ